ncbi:DNA polymerase III subunit epsilon [Bifidobacterium sp. SO4]|uniref:DNA polymerase III subunit epsilon n=1 Tax=Bifidobacterium sp. SO4 TaxID=2809030 RepID=UPI001BDBC8E9|nr:DNA polymerase III subunit epsilon [Bifidobacterium sp. SO4]MBT1170449.1 DNA polymerase III subunit epsilon [Bifidobacterium sp. SO4]
MGNNSNIDRSWLTSAKESIGQWSYIMLKDADNNDIDWDWVRTLDLEHGIGVAGPADLEPGADSGVHDLLKADLEIRDRLEAIIAKMSMVFMRDFDRHIKTYELPRALAYADRRLNDQIALLRDRGVAEGLWTVADEDRQRVTVPVLTAARDGVVVDDIQDRTAEIVNARAEQRKADRAAREEARHHRQMALINADEVKYGSVEAGPDESAPADSSSDAGSPDYLIEGQPVINDDNPAVPGVEQVATDETAVAEPRYAQFRHAAAEHTAEHMAAAPKEYWREVFLPGRDVDNVMGIDLETNGTEPYRAYIIDVGFEYMNMRSPRPADAPSGYSYDKDYYQGGDAYDQHRFSFGVTPEAARHGNAFIIQLTGIDISQRTGEEYPLFDEDPAAQADLLKRLTSQPFVAHMATFEHSFFMLNVAGYAEAYRNGHVTIIDTLPMSRLWDEGSIPCEGHPDGDNTLDAYAKRQGALREDDAERHLGLEDTHIMLLAMKHHLTQLKAEARGPWGPGGKAGVGGKRIVNHRRHYPRERRTPIYD